MFNLGILILVTIAFLLFGYSITHADIFAPFCVFLRNVFNCRIYVSFFANMYKLELHLNTIAIIALGMITFGIVSAFSILIGQMFVSMKKNILENIFL